MSGPGPTRYRIDAIEVDPICRCVRRNGTEEHLRSRVFDLLIYLIENRKRPVTKQELVDRVWGGIAVTDSVLYKTVLELRRVLADDPESPIYVKTLPKLGYQFVGPVEIDGGAASPVSAVAAERVVTPAPPPVGETQRRRISWSAAVALALALAAGAWMWRSDRGRHAPMTEVAWWRFDEGSGVVARDGAGRNHGNLLRSAAGGGTPHWAPGRWGNAVSVGGGNSVEGEFRDADWPAMTAMAWVQPHESAAPESTIFDSSRFRLTLTPHGVLITRNESIGAVQQWKEGKWWHVAAVDEGPITAVGRIFVNGVELASGTFSPIKQEHDRWRAGQSFADSAPFRGLIDDLRVYGRPLRRLEIEAIYRCGKEEADLTLAGKGHYYLPVFASGAAIEDDGTIVNGAKDFGGIQIGRKDDCGVAGLRGADLGQDVRIAMDLELMTDGEDHTTEGGPYFRSRRAYPGDGIAGGTSGGYWVKLGSDGQIRVWQLRPYHPIATASIAAFDRKRGHRLEVEARGKDLRVRLDGTAVRFEQDGRMVDVVAVDEAGPGLGTAGVAFSADQNRGLLGGQRARRVVVELLRED